MVDFDAIGEIADACSALVGVSDDDYLVTTVDKFLSRYQSGIIHVYDSSLQKTIDRCDSPRRLQSSVRT